MNWNAARSLLVCLCLAALALCLTTAAAVGWQGYFFMRDLRTIPDRLDQRAQKLQDAAINVINVRATALEKRVDHGMWILQSEVRQTRSALVSESAAWRSTSTNQIAPFLRDTVGQLSQFNDTVASLRSGLQPTLDNTAATLDETRKAVHDLHPQMLGLVAASKVTAGETAQAMKVIRDATPGLLANAEETNKHIAGITGDIHTVTTQIAKPKTFWGKVWAAITSLAGLARFI